MRTVSTIWTFLGGGALGVMPLACGAGSESVAVRPGAPKDGLTMPRITEERIGACVTEYAKQLDEGSWAFRPTLEVDQYGRFSGMNVGGIPKTAPDFAACTRDALSNMVVPDVIFNLRPTHANVDGTPATAEQRMQMGSPAIAVVVVVGLSELVFEAGAYTILFAVTVKVVEKAKDDVVEAVKRRRLPKDDCADHYDKCMATFVGDQDGNHWKQTLCGACIQMCVAKGSWPSSVGNGSCEYWRANWN